MQTEGFDYGRLHEEVQAVANAMQELIENDGPHLSKLEKLCEDLTERGFEIKTEHRKPVPNRRLIEEDVGTVNRRGSFGFAFVMNF
jgi:hypothetical protein